MVEEIVLCYMHDEEKWYSWGDSENLRCHTEAEDYLPKRYVHLYYKYHGFHDWDVKQILLKYNQGTSVSVTFVLQHHSEKEIVLTFCDCCNFRLIDEFCPKEYGRKRSSENDLLILSYYLLENRMIEVGIGLSDGSCFVFLLQKNKISYKVNLLHKNGSLDLK